MANRFQLRAVKHIVRYRSPIPPPFGHRYVLITPLISVITVGMHALYGVLESKLDPAASFVLPKDEPDDELGAFSGKGARVAPAPQPSPATKAEGAIADFTNGA